jgi:hypothetical protein
MHHPTGIILHPLCRLTSGSCVQRILVRILQSRHYLVLEISFLFSQPHLPNEPTPVVP